MKRLIHTYGAILMLALLLVNISSPMSVYLSYQLNKEYIATQLCENKDRPEITCNGQCILMEKLQQIDQNKETEKSDQLMIFSLTFKYLHALPIQLVNGSQSVVSNDDAQLASFYSYQYLHSISHPPEVLS